MIEQGVGHGQQEGKAVGRAGGQEGRRAGGQEGRRAGGARFTLIDPEAEELGSTAEMNVFLMQKV